MSSFRNEKTKNLKILCYKIKILRIKSSLSTSHAIVCSQFFLQSILSEFKKINHLIAAGGLSVEI